MKELFISLKNNLSNLFSVIGILLTIYFSIYYVPQYSEEIRIKRIESTNSSLINIVQELVYNEHQLDEKDLKTMVKGKEIKNNIVYPYTLDELLIQTQESFLNNKFIPLDQRKLLVEKIDTIREKLTESTHEQKKSYIQSTTIYEWLITIFGILASFLGVVSTWLRIKNQKESELEEKLEETKESLKKQVIERVFLENETYAVLKEIVPDAKLKHAARGYGIDFLIKTGEGERLGVEVKYTETDLIPLRTINNLISIARGKGIPILLITNAQLTKNAKKKLEDYNWRFPDSRIDTLLAAELTEMKEELTNYINKKV